MRESLYQLCENFIENRNAIKSCFGWENQYLYPVCAAIFTDKRQSVDAARMKRCRDILKDRTGIFSNFRGNSRLAMISMLAVEPNPEEKLDQALMVYNILKEYFFSSQYLPVAAMTIANLTETGQYDRIAARTRKIYDLMKKEHPFLTSSEDSVFAAMLALSGLTEEQVVQETEKCYELLKAEFFSGNALQSLSHVLALGDGTAQEKCSRTIELYRELKKRGYKYGTSYELATLGILALLPEEFEQVMQDMMETDDYLSEKKGYGIFGVGKKQRLMHAAMLVTSDHMGENDSPTMHSAAIGGTISLIAAQQAAMCAAIAASSAAAASSSSE